jgi:hypothetical protein
MSALGHKRTSDYDWIRRRAERVSALCQKQTLELHPARNDWKSSEPMSDDRRVVVDITKRQADRLIEFWLRALVAFILAFAW